MPLTLTVDEVVRQQVQLQPELRRLTIEKGDTAAPTRIEAVFHFYDKAGKWNGTMEHVTVTFSDTEGVTVRSGGADTVLADEKAAPQIGTALRDMILAAVVSGEAAKNFGCDGQMIRDAGEAILAALGFGG